MKIQILLYLLSAALILVGLAGTLLPVLPGLPLVFLGMLVAAWTDHFEKVSGGTVVLLGLLTLVSLAVDVLATSLGAKKVGASKFGMIGALVGTLVGGLLFNLPGLIVGPFLGAVAGEMLHARQWQRAAKVGFGSWLGLALGAAFKLALVAAMLGIFVVAWLVD